MLFILFQDSVQNTILDLVIISPWALLDLFLRFPLFLMTLTVLRSTGQELCPLIEVCPMFSSQLD